ncbi:MAG TPA: family 10 glycosylhydrolase [Candidatus Bathyarchaeia archaeon]|nr:family 10 glycosylhydrolase [Candidatus Bathyarchaeia archaeon]
MERRTFLKSLPVITALAGAAGAGSSGADDRPPVAPGANIQANPPAGLLVERIDCTQDYPPERYFAHGDVKVVESSAGRYREAEAKPLSRFGYRFPIRHVGRPHVAVIRYPDDKRRYMCIMDGTSYDLTTGVFTGWAQPLTGRMIEIEQIFWPRWEECSIVFMTWSEGEPAAAASIEIRELEDLPALSIPGDAGDGAARELGIQYEDPCGCCAAEGALTREQWIDHLVQYARHTGQNLLVYPMAWYHGPQFPSEREPSDGFGLVVARDRRQYSRWTTHPVDWYAGLLDRFAREGIGFQGALTLLRLGSLLQKMNIDLDAIRAGADTFNNMLWNDQVQSSTQDWTPIYNARNFNRIAELLKDKPPAEPWNVLSEWAYGERAVSGAHMGPMFNPLHPVVQEALAGFVREIGARYASYPAFRGISFNMFASAMPWFGSIHSGYDDYSVSLFEKQTGISVPIDPKAPDRFSKRYEYLTTVCRPAWVDWRCQMIRQLFGDLLAALKSARPNLRLTITLWDETTVPSVLGTISAATQLGARPSMLEFYKDAGIDLDLYRDEEGLEVDRGMGNSRDRGGHGYNMSGGTNLPVEALTMYRDFDALDEDTLEAFRAHARPGAFIFNCWVEAWGRHVWFCPEAGDPGVPEFSVMDGQPVEGILRINSEYPKDGFWWDSQLRITPGFPTALHFLEPYAFALAEFDACRITRGGLFLDKAHTDELRQFAAAYRALPRVKFDTVGAATDPAAVRTLVWKGRRYFYVVNREYYPLEIQLRFSAPPTAVQDLATGQSPDGALAAPFTLGPYELRAFAIEPPTTEINSFSATPPQEILAAITHDTQAAFEAFARLRAAGTYVPGMDAFEARMRDALNHQRTAWLRRALTSYIVRKAQEA